MKKSEFDWKSGVVTSWKIDDLDLNQGAEAQLELLKEDIVQVQFGTNVFLDLGWYPEFDPHGQFGLVVVKIADPNGASDSWAKPNWALHFKNLKNLAENLRQAIETAERIFQNKI